MMNYPSFGFVFSLNADLVPGAERMRIQTGITALVVQFIPKMQGQGACVGPQEHLAAGIPAAQKSPGRGHLLSLSQVRNLNLK
jgi:hypothetical protein